VLGSFRIMLFKSLEWVVRKISLKAFLRQILGYFGVGVTTYANLISLQAKSSQRPGQDLEFLKTIDDSNLKLMIPLLDRSNSQSHQDLFVLSETNFKKGGVFVEFGAADGFSLSNTYLLETSFSWTGILAEPASVWSQKLINNRPNSSIDNRCVWGESKQIVLFNETYIPELSTIDSFSSLDGNKLRRGAGKKYEVETVSLNDLLRQHNAPKFIDYLSIDTEGSELEILKGFDFKAYTIGIITVEHNYSFQRELIFNLLSFNGYQRKYMNISYGDDFYVKI
jgi:FkbM family methyltransferase